MRSIAEKAALRCLTVITLLGVPAIAEAQPDPDAYVAPPEESRDLAGTARVHVVPEGETGRYELHSWTVPMDATGRSWGVMNRPLRVCVSPCAVTMRRGTMLLSVGRVGEGPLRGGGRRQAVFLNDGDTLAISIQNRERMRQRRLRAGGLTPASGVLLLALGARRINLDEAEDGESAGPAGPTLARLGAHNIVVGLPFLFAGLRTRPRATIRVVGR